MAVIKAGLAVFILLVGFCGALSAVDLGWLTYLDEGFVAGRMAMIMGLTDEEAQVTECDVAEIGYLYQDGKPTNKFVVWFRKGGNIVGVEDMNSFTEICSTTVGYSLYFNEARYRQGKRLFVFSEYKSFRYDLPDTTKIPAA